MNLQIGFCPFNEKSVYVNAVLGQCFSGGFIEELSKVGCFVAAASKGSESSWSCGDIPYDEFVYPWTSAINEGNAFGQPIYSDVDNNHRVTMEEAFDMPISMTGDVLWKIPNTNPILYPLERI